MILFLFLFDWLFFLCFSSFLKKVSPLDHVLGKQIFSQYCPVCSCMCPSISSQSHGGAAALPGLLHQSLNPPSFALPFSPPLSQYWSLWQLWLVSQHTYRNIRELTRWIVPSWFNSWIPHNSFSTHSLFFLLLHNLRRGTVNASLGQMCWRWAHRV